MANTPVFTGDRTPTRLVGALEAATQALPVWLAASMALPERRLRQRAGSILGPAR